MDLLESSLNQNLPDCLVLASAEELNVRTDPREAARLLGAALVVEVGVESTKDRTSLTVNVHDTAHSTDLFTSTVHESNGKFPEASAVVNPGILAITRHYGKSRPDRLEDPSVPGYTAYLAGKQFSRHRNSRSSLSQALGSYREASSHKWVNGRLHVALAETNVSLYELSRDAAWIEPSLAAIDAAIMLPGATRQDQYRIANLLERLGYTTRSIVLFEHLAREVPESDGVQRAIARLSIKAGMLKRATQASQKAAALNPNSWFNQFTLGKVYIAASSFPAAIAAFRAALSLDRTSAKTLNNLGAAYLYADNPTRAVFYFRQAIGLNPDAPAYNNMGVALLQSGDQHGAIRSFLEALRIEPASDIYAANVGLTYSYAGNHKEAKRYFKLACQLAWRSPEIRTHFAAVTGRIAYYYSQLGDISRAVRMISSARDLNPNSIDLLYHDLVVRAISGDLTRARAAAKGLLSRGYSVSRITCNPQLHTLLQDQGFREFLSEYEQRNQRGELPHCSLPTF